MDERNEKALTRLSLAAFAIDALVITMIAVLIASLLTDGFWRQFPAELERLLKSKPYLLTLPVAYLLHTFVVEIIAGGRSLGRSCLGLTVRDEAGHPSINSTARMQRFVSEILQFGTGSLRFNMLATYHKRASGHLHSDWVGTATLINSKRVSPPRSGSPTSGSVPPQQCVRQLIILSGAEKGKITPLGSGRQYWQTGLFLIGRSSQNCDLALPNDGAVSRLHCSICVQDNNPKIKDGAADTQVGSTHGTYVNGRRISATGFTPLQSGDQISLGNTILKFQ